MRFVLLMMVLASALTWAQSSSDCRIKIKTQTPVVSSTGGDIEFDVCAANPATRRFTLTTGIVPGVPLDWASIVSVPPGTTGKMIVRVEQNNTGKPRDFDIVLNDAVYSWDWKQNVSQTPYEIGSLYCQDLRSLQYVRGTSIAELLDPIVIDCHSYPRIQNNAEHIVDLTLTLNTQVTSSRVSDEPGSLSEALYVDPEGKVTQGAVDGRSITWKGVKIREKTPPDSNGSYSHVHQSRIYNVRANVAASDDWSLMPEVPVLYGSLTASGKSMPAYRHILGTSSLAWVLAEGLRLNAGDTGTYNVNIASPAHALKIARGTYLSEEGYIPLGSGYVGNPGKVSSGTRVTIRREGSPDGILFEAPTSVVGPDGLVWLRLVEKPDVLGSGGSITSADGVVSTSAIIPDHIVYETVYSTTDVRNVRIPLRVIVPSGAPTSVIRMAQGFAPYEPAKLARVTSQPIPRFDVAQGLEAIQILGKDYKPLTIVKDLPLTYLEGDFAGDYLRAEGGHTSQYRWSITGNMPPGMSYNSDGTIGGRATSVGEYPVTIVVTEGYSSDSWTTTMRVIDPKAAPCSGWTGHPIVSLARVGGEVQWSIAAASTDAAKYCMPRIVGNAPWVSIVPKPSGATGTAVLRVEQNTSREWREVVVCGLTCTVLRQAGTSGPSRPTITTVKPGYASVFVAFSAPDDDGGSPITSYSARCQTAGVPGTVSADGTSSPVMVTGLTNGAPYTCFVVASNAVGSGFPSLVSEAVTPSEGSVTLTPSSARISSAGGTGTIVVTAATGRPWSARTESPWIQITSSASGTGSGTLTYAVAANGGADRTGTVRVDDQVFTITQKSGVVVSPEALSISVPAGASPVVQVLDISAADPGGTWTAAIGESGSAWVELSAGSGTLPARINVTIRPQGLSVGTYSSSVAINGVIVPVTLQVVPPTITLTHDSVFFQQLVSGEPLRPQVVALSANAGGLTYSATALAPWLTLGRASGAIPGSVELSANAAGLPPGEYSATVRISVAGQPEITLPVVLRVPMLTVAPVDSPELSGQQVQVDLTAGQVRVAHSSGVTSVNQQIPIMVHGGGQRRTFTASATTIGGGAWLAVNPPSGTTPARVTLSSSASGLPPGTYRGYVTLRSTGVVPAASDEPRSKVAERAAQAESGESTSTISVVLTVDGTGLLKATPDSVSLSTTANTVYVAVAGTAGAPFYVASSAAWLRVSAASETLPTTLTLQFMRGALGPGTYTATVSVTSPAAPNSPLLIPVRATVSTPAPPERALSVDSDGMLFSGEHNGPPLTGILRVESPNGRGVFTATASASWISLSLTSGRAPAEITVRANPAGLATGRHHGTITLRSGDESLVVPVTLELPDRPRLSASVSQLAGAGEFNVTSTSAVLRFTAETVNTPWLSVTQTARTTPARVAVTVATLPPGTHRGTVRLSPELGTAPPLEMPVIVEVGAPPAQLQPAAVVGLGSGKPGPLAPGLLVRLVGLDLPRVNETRGAPASDGAFPVALDGVGVLFDGRPAPVLRVSQTEVDAMVPFELHGQMSTVLQVSLRGRLSDPIRLPVTNSRPEILPLPDSGVSVARHADSLPVTAADPARAGRILTVVASGVGLTSPVLDSRMAVAQAVPVQLHTPVEIRVGGQRAEILWTGPVPGQAPGVMQFSIVTPSETTGDDDIVIEMARQK